MVRGAGARRPSDSVETVRALLSHPKFSLKNPNRVRALIGSFVHANPTGFNRVDGAGYELLARQALEIDGFNPHNRRAAAWRLRELADPRTSPAGPAPRPCLRILLPRSFPPTATRFVTKTLGAS
jgi:aminopeptidase N